MERKELGEDSCYKLVVYGKQIKVGQLAVDLEIRMKGHLLSMELFSGNAGTVVHSSSI